MSMEDMGKEEITELFSKHNFIVTDIDINDKCEELYASIYILVSDVLQYGIDTIEHIVNKIKTMREELIKDGLIDDIMFGDLHNGGWRILVYFKGD